MLIEEVRELDPLERLLYFVKERRKIFHKHRRKEPKPWTDDKILQTQYFTNIRREDDKVTVWFRENIREPLRNSSDVVFATIAFRWFNWPDTGEALLGFPKFIRFGSFVHWNCERVVDLLSRQGRVFTGAFNISNSGSTKPKVNRVCEDYINPVWEVRRGLVKRITGGSLENAFNELRKLPGLGGSGFMAAQVVCDLAYTEVLEDAIDFYTWCSWGPGSKRGMNRVLGYPEDYPMPRPKWDGHLKELRKTIQKSLALRLHARDVQNCLCEFGKYERGLEGRRLKRRYPGA